MSKKSILIVVFVVVLLVLIAVPIIYENWGNPAPLSSISIQSVMVENDEVTILGVHHNSAFVFKGHRVKISDDSMYITVKTGAVGKNDSNLPSDEIYISEPLPENVKRIYLDDGKNTQLLWERGKPIEAEDNSHMTDDMQTVTQDVDEEIIWSENAQKTIDEVKETLAKKGWRDIRGVEGLVNTEDVRPVIINPTPEEENMLIYTLIGEVDGMYDNDIMAMVRISFADKMSEGNVYKVLYISESGRDMITEEIVDAHDEELWNWMYSY